MAYSPSFSPKRLKHSGNSNELSSLTFRCEQDDQKKHTHQHTTGQLKYGIHFPEDRLFKYLYEDDTASPKEQGSQMRLTKTGEEKGKSG